jgi:aryl-alcohol dehydrogenase-like predicted oxidoreductase
MVRAVENSLRRLNTDYIDLYWLHAWDFTTPADEEMRGLDDLVRSGKIVYIGVSDTPAWKIAELNTLAELRGWSRFIALQVPYSLARRDVERELNPMARELGLGITPWSPLAAGVLTGKYSREDMEREQELIRSGQAKVFGTEQRLVGLNAQKLRIAEAVRRIAEQVGRSPAQVAINWLMSRPGVTSPILGARRVEQLDDNLAALDFSLDEQQLQELEEVSAIEMGFPHDFLRGRFVTDNLTGGTSIERRWP